MIDRNGIIEYLRAGAQAYPTVVMERLERGSRVQKSAGLWYEIDDPDIHHRLGEYQVGIVPYGAIRNKLRTVSNQESLDLFGESPVVPFSKVYEAGVGQCLEKAILVQLAAQKGRPSFLVNGLLDLESDPGVGFHAYNVIEKDGIATLLDAENPLVVTEDGKQRMRPYAAPLDGIEDDGDRKFLLPKEWKNGRTYSLF